MIITGFFQLLGVLLVIIEVIYVFYSLIIVRQVNLLNKSFMTEFSAVFTIVSYAHLLLAFVVILISFVTLI